MSSPLVSIVMGAYNAAPYIETTLASLVDQSYQNLEIVVVDDGSTDETGAVVQRCAAIDDRIRLVTLPHNLGRSGARNAGIDAALGEWVAINDADDLWHRERIAELIAAAVRFPRSSVVTDDLMSYSLTDSNEPVLGHRHVSRSTWRLGDPHEISVRGWFMDNSCHMRPMIKRSFLETSGVRYPLTMSAGEDNNFYMSLVFNRQNPHVVRVPRPMYYYVEGGSTRHTSMAQNRLWSIRNVIESTGSQQLERWAKRSDPGRLWVLNRSDETFSREGRSAGVDEVAQHGPIELPTLNPLRGYLTLVRWKLLEVLSKAADRKLRPQIAADIARQRGRLLN